jgi:hypothetical protein
MTTKTAKTPVSYPPRTVWEDDLAAAYDAGHAAVAALSATSMTVCGFARVEVRPRTSAWAKWLKTRGWYSSDYFKCVYANIGGFGQSFQRKHKEAFAAAFAAHLTAKGYPGVDYTCTTD